MAKRTTTVTGSTGEHIVAPRLAGMGYIVAITRGGSPGVDLMVATADGSRTIALQVKTSSSAIRPRMKKTDATFWEWPIGSRAADLKSEHLWYAFVDLRDWPNSENHPEVYLIPSKEVADQIRYEIENKWSRTLFRLGPAEGQEYPKRDKYREAWKSLEDALDA